MQSTGSGIERATVVIVVGAWLVAIVSVLLHPLFVSHDSISNYAHVWYISREIWTRHRFPLHMSMLAQGHALASPYALVPWTSAALLYPLLGGWVVTLWLASGFVAMIILMFVAFPELRRGWAVSAVLVNPALVMALFVGQLPFIWAMAFLFASIASWRRHRRWLGTALLVLAMTTHAAVVAPMALLLIAGCLLVTPERSTLAIHTLVAATLSLPAAYLVATSPAVEQTTIRFRIEQFFRVLATRGTVLLVPLVLLGIVRLARTASFRALIQRSLAGVFVLLAGLNAALLNTMNSYAWRAPWRTPDEVIKTFIDSPEYLPGAVYRVLGYSDGRVSMLRLIQTGARLDGEFFPESQARRSWPSIVAYEQTLIDRRVDVVIAWHTYDTRWHTNEHALLRTLADGAGCADPRSSIQLGRRATVLTTNPSFDAYKISLC